jgi:hypothetical protein
MVRLLNSILGTVASKCSECYRDQAKPEDARKFLVSGVFNCPITTCSLNFFGPYTINRVMELAQTCSDDHKKKADSASGYKPSGNFREPIKFDGQ